jgi:hypothetical protein
MNKDNNVMKLTENDIKRRATEKRSFGDLVLISILKDIK